MKLVAVMRIAGGILLWLVITLLIVACGSGQPKGEVIVYVAAPLSGFQANGGQTVAGGVRLAAEQINRAGGLLGYKMTVVALDDESDSDVATGIAEQVKDAVAEGKQILGVIGHYNSGQTLAAMKIYRDLPLIVITPTSSEVSLTEQGYRNFFRINANDAVQAQVDAEFLAKTLNARRVVIMHNDTAYGLGLRDQMRQMLAAEGVNVVEVIQVKEGQDKFDPEVTRLQVTQPDAIFYAGYEIECPYLRYALHQASISVPFLASDGCFLAATIDESSGAAEGMYVSSFAPSPATVVSQEWMKAYQATEYRNPDTYSINGYTAMSVLAEAAKKAGSLEANRIADALHTLNIDTLVGPVSYNDQGDLRQPEVYLFQVQQSDFIQVARKP
jgi:branched-chain amino acid transport system substrate-binding protein